MKKLAIIDNKRCTACQSCMFACSRRDGHAGLSNSCIGVKTAGGFEGDMTIVVCRACADPPCAKVCPTNALIPKTSGGVRLEKSKCIGCKLCQQTCVIDAVFWNKEENKPVICIQCGYCVGFCPHKVIDLRTTK